MLTSPTFTPTIIQGCFYLERGLKLNQMNITLVYATRVGIIRPGLHSTSSEKKTDIASVINGVLVTLIYGLHDICSLDTLFDRNAIAISKFLRVLW